jgi:hypothetical protein
MLQAEQIRKLKELLKAPTATPERKDKVVNRTGESLPSEGATQ